MFTENACKKDNFLSGDLVEDLLEIIKNAIKHERLVKIEKLEHFFSISLTFGAKSWTPTAGNSPTKSRQVR